VKERKKRRKKTEIAAPSPVTERSGGEASSATLKKTKGFVKTHSERVKAAQKQEKKGSCDWPVSVKGIDHLAQKLKGKKQKDVECL